MSGTYPQYLKVGERPVRRLRQTMPHEILTPSGDWEPVDDFKALWSEGESLTQREFDRLVNSYLKQ